MASRVQPAFRRLALAILAVELFLHPCRITHAAETILIWRAGASQSVAVSQHTDHFSDWLELEFPPGTAPVRIIPSDHYAWLDDRVIGFRNRMSFLAVHRAIPESAFTLEQPEGSLAIPIPLASEVSGVAVGPDHPASFVSLRWSGIFGAATTHALSAQLKADFRMTNFVSTVDGVEIKGLTYSKERGSLKFNNALELTDVHLENERLPIFRPKIPNTREDWWIDFVTEEWIEAANGQRLKLWLAAISDRETAAKAFLNGQEITWTGGRDPKWFFDSLRLFGASGHNEKNVLIREANLKDSVAAAQYQKQLRPVIFHIDQLAAELGLTNEGSIYVRSVKKEGAELVIHFSGVLKTQDIPEIRYNPSTGAATIRADGWEMPVTIEPFTAGSMKP